VLQNAATAKINGFEAGVDALLTSALTLRVSGALLDAKYDSFPAATIFVPNTQEGPTNPIALINAPANLSGGRMPDSPVFTSNIDLDWQVPAGNIGPLTLSANWYHSSRETMDPAGSIKVPAYDLVNASARLEPEACDENCSVTLWVKNLTDDVHLQYGADVAFGRILNYSPPRMFGATLTYKFSQ
jgi:outer membrane receptor protein involved in Fe transport